MADAEATAVLKIGGDTTGLQRAIEQGARATSRLGDAVEGMRSKWDSAISGIVASAARLDGALALVERGVRTLRTGLDWSADIAQFDALSKALPTGAFEKFSAASKESASRSDLLRVSVKSMTGELGLTEDQMTRVWRAAEALSRHGMEPTATIAEQLARALQKNGETLDNFGVAIERTGDQALDTERALAKLDQIVADTGPVDARTASLRQLNAQLEDVTLWIKRVVAAAVAALADLVRANQEYGLWGDFGEAASEAISNPLNIRGNRGTVGRLFKRGGYAELAAMQAEYNRPTLTYEQEMSQDFGEGTVVNVAEYRAGVAAGARLDYSGYDVGSLDAAGTRFTSAPTTGFGLGDYESNLDELEARGDVSSAFSGRVDPFGESRVAGSIGSDATERASAAMADLTYQTALYRDTAREAFGALGSGLVMAAEAALTGGQSVSAVVRQTLRGLGTQAKIRAGMELGEGFAALALGPLGGVSAGAHFKAAAIFAGVAAAAGIAAGAMGGGGAGGGGGYAPAGGFRAPSTGRGGAEGGDTYYITISNSHVMDKADMAKRIADEVRAAKRGGHSREGFVSSMSGG